MAVYLAVLRRGEAISRRLSALAMVSAVVLLIALAGTLADEVSIMRFHF